MKTWPWKNNQKFTKAWRQSLRNNPTDAEAELWEKLRRHRFHGYHWRRQVSIDTYVVDFYCTLAKLAIELDGSIHNRPDVHAHDVARTQRLNELGIRVLRFTNEQILNDWNNVAEQILKALVPSEATPRHNAFKKKKNNLSHALSLASPVEVRGSKPAPETGEGRHRTRCRVGNLGCPPL